MVRKEEIRYLSDRELESCLIGASDGERLTPRQKEKMLLLKEVIERAKGKKKHIVKEIREPEDVYRYLKEKFRGERKYKENFITIFMDARCNILKDKTISIGSLTATIVSPREIFEAACKYHAASIIVAHNHPSGYCRPSKEDISLTEKLVLAGKMMDIPVLDHVIIDSKIMREYRSMKEKGDVRF